MIADYYAIDFAKSLESIELPRVCTTNFAAKTKLKTPRKHCFFHVFSAKIEAEKQDEMCSRIVLAEISPSTM